MSKEKEIAKWMFEQLDAQLELYQEDVVYDITRKFGDKYVYDNENGNPAISRDVLKEFRKLTEKTVVWDRGGRFWRKRKSYDEEGKRQTDY